MTEQKSERAAGTSAPACSGRTWHDVVIECERILGCPDTAASPTMSNLPNLVRDLKHGISPNAELSFKKGAKRNEL